MTSSEREVRSAVASAGERLAGLLEQSEQARRIGRHRDGVHLSQRAAELAELLGDVTRQTRALRLQATHLFRVGEYEAAARTAERARQLLEGLGDHAALCDALATLSMAYNEMGLHDEALQTVTDCLTAAQKAADRTLLCWAFNRVGCVQHTMGNASQAREFLLHALELARELRDEDALFSALNNLSEVLLGLAGQQREQSQAAAARVTVKEGLRYAEEALEVSRRSGNRHQVAMAQANLGMMRGLAGDDDAAFAMLREARETAVEHGYKPVARTATLYQAELLRGRGDVPAAIEALRGLLPEALASNDKTLQLQLRTQLHVACKAGELYREALEEHEQVLALERQRSANVASLRARALINRLELDNARLQAERARLQAELHRVNSARLEEEKQVLEARTVELDRRVNEDALTGLANRRQVESQLPRLFAEAKAGNRPLAVAIIDIDHFKRINDRIGHFAADEVLRRVGAMLKTAAGPEDIAARLGGEEFVLVLCGRNTAQAAALCESLRALVEQAQWPESYTDLQVTVSIGACDDTGITGHAELLARADALLFQAKRKGRNRVESVSD